ncbi:cysteine-rich VLP protein [Paenibacillus sp. J5C_2022]|uniref:cysteine-rich VLP protein n=1 Tax=Paenibacillus sp. J5C2022 TaxID=2977129 RepID=UPI0021CE1C91|nr:cysteine-rich VLP protein [Paenibacillus sp. J5C2022]MCU6709785.1 cysteine-rich VLP protein [Paenibacillus sp. J5C2022]
MSDVTARIQSMARTQCATFDTSTADRCLMDCQCVYFRQQNGRCRYFENAVLPADPALEQSYKAERGLADGSKYVPCRSCRAAFKRKSGRQIYCEKCGAEAARKARNKRAREYRRKQATT